MNAFHLEILSPERPFYIGDCISLVVPISDGMMGIMANHSPITTVILDGEVRFTMPDGERRVCAVMRGMVDVDENCVRVLCESALAPDEIDEDAERRDAEEALIEMKKEQSRKDYTLWKLTFNKAVNNLKTKTKHDKNDEK